jgi:hypothetical protein
MRKVIAKIRLLSSEEGGRSQAIPPMAFGCPVFFDAVPALSDHAYDARLLVSERGRAISPGETVEAVGMIFLSPEDVFPHLRPGTTFTLWEGKTIGSGEVVAIE